MIHRRPDGAFAATERGSAFLTETYQVHGEVTEELPRSLAEQLPNTGWPQHHRPVPLSFPVT